MKVLRKQNVKDCLRFDCYDFESLARFLKKQNAFLKKFEILSCFRFDVEIVVFPKETEVVDWDQVKYHQGGYRIEIEDGRRTFYKKLGFLDGIIRQGDYLLAIDNGAIEIVSEAEFKEKFEVID